MVVDFRVIWAADFDNVIRLYDCRPARRPRTQAARRHTKIQKILQIYRYWFRFRGYLGR